MNLNKVMRSVQYSVKAHEGISRKRVLLSVAHTWRTPLEQAGAFTERCFSIGAFKKISKEPLVSIFVFLV